jgi:hypothetical protein
MKWDAYPQTTIENEIGRFQSLCQSFGQECIYTGAVSLTCAENEVFNSRYDTYETLVYVSIGVFLGKEFLKLLAILYCFWLKSVPVNLRYFVSGSLFAPVLLYFRIPNFRETIINHNPASWEVYSGLFYDTILETMNQLVITLYYYIVVASTGLSILQLLVLPSNLVSLCIAMAQLYKAWNREKKERAATVAAAAEATMELPKVERIITKKTKSDQGGEKAAGHHGNKVMAAPNNGEAGFTVDNPMRAPDIKTDM